MCKIQGGVGTWVGEREGLGHVGVCLNMCPCYACVWI